MMSIGVFEILGLTVICIAGFALISVARWANSRRLEREAYYKSETLKKIADTQGAGVSTALEFLREEEKNARRRRREGQKLGGTVTSAVGIAMMIFIALADQSDREPVYLVGLIPLSVGLAILFYAYVLGPKE